MTSLDNIISMLEEQIAEIKAEYGDLWLKMRTPDGGYLAAPLLTALANARAAKVNQEAAQ